VENSYKNLPLRKLLIFAACIILISQIFSSDFRIKILNIFRFPLKLVSGSYYVLRDIPDFKEIRKENKLLKENIGNLNGKLVDLKESRVENKRMRQLLGFREDKKRKFIPGMVIAREALGLGDTIVIDKGKAQGVYKGMVVISVSGLVGRVRESGRSISRAVLITHPDSVVGGIVQRTRDEGAIEGNMSSGVIMKYLELDSDVKEGDKIITSGFSGVFEKGILIGEVVSVEKDVSGLYLRAIVKPEVDLRRLEDALVIR